MCSHNVVDYDEFSFEYYCVKCGDTVDKPEDWDDDN